MARLTFKRVYVGEYVIPDEAISLIEDIQTLDRMLDMLGTISERSITTAKFDQEKANSEARQMIRRIGFLLSSLHSVAQDKLRHQYLAGKPIKAKQSQQTLRDVWEILQERLNDRVK